MSRHRDRKPPRTVHPPWWRGTRGEVWVLGQLLLFALLLWGPRTLPGWPAWPSPLLFRLLGCTLLCGGGLLLGAGLWQLGPALTPLPWPKEGAPLVCRGVYAWVRHPIYSGSLLLALGWALLVQGWLTLGSSLLLYFYLDLKSRREERLLLRLHPDYAHYQASVPKLIPFIR